MSPEAARLRDTAPDVGLSEAVAEALAEHDGMPWLFGDENIPTLTKDERAVYLARAAAVLTAVEAAHTRDLAALRERAEVAEAKVAAVEALADEWDRGPDEDMTLGYASDALRAALADRPAGGEGR